MKIIDKLIHMNFFHKSGEPCLKLDRNRLNLIDDFNKRIVDKKILFETVPCLCGLDQFSLVASTDRYGLIQSTILCGKCGLMQSNPRMTDGEYRSFYESDCYRQLYDGDDFVEHYENSYTDGRADFIYQPIIKHKNLSEIKSVLEFGAGGGWNLVPFVKQGIVVKGYDLSKGLVKLGNEKGINLINGDVYDIEGKYDVIIANHVVEHFINFFSDMNRLKSHLNVGGIMYVSVPDIENFSKQQLQNAHTYYFTKETFQHYMGKCGLKMIHWQPEYGGHMSCIFVMGDPEVNSLDNHYKKMVEMLKAYNRLYYPRRFLVNALDFIGLKNVLKRMLNFLKKKHLLL